LALTRFIGKKYVASLVLIIYSLAIFLYPLNSLVIPELEHYETSKAIAEKLGRSTRERVEVNLSKIERYAEDGDTVIVPGVVLSSGQLSKPVTVAAWRFSPSSVKKIKDNKGKCLTIEELVKENPKGSKVKIIS